MASDEHVISTTSSVLHRQLDVRPALAVSRKESVIVRDGGKHIIDLSSGAGVVGLGHLFLEQLMYASEHRPLYVHSQNWTADAVERLADEMLQLCDWQGGGVAFLSTGTEAVEAAIKLALQSQYERGRRGRPSICAREHSYHGNSLAMLAVGHHPRRNSFPHTTECFPVFRFDAYMPTWCGGDAAQALDDKEYINKCLRSLECELISLATQNRPAVVVVEPICGMALGVEPASVNYLVALRALCAITGATLVYDEVFCGNWRTGLAFAWQYYNGSRSVIPDIVAVGKGLANGIVPLSAVVMSPETRATLKSNRIWHSSTFQNHPFCCAVGLRVQEELASRTVDIARGTIAVLLQSSLVPQLRALSGVQVEGIGCLWGVRLSRHKLGLHERARKALLANGINVYTDGGTVGGSGNTLLLAPPYTIEPSTLQWAVETMVNVLAVID